MDFSKFTFSRTYKDRKILWFDFDITITTNHKRGTFLFYKTLIHFLINNPNKEIYLTQSQTDDFIDQDGKFVVNLEKYQLFCKGIGQRGENRAQAFFTRALRNYSEEEKEEIRRSVTEDQIVEVIREYSEGQKVSFLERLRSLEGIQLSTKDFGDMSNQDLLKILSEFIEKTDNKSANVINSLVSIKNFKDVLREWENNKTNQDEEFWQKLFQDNSWILSQIFSCPFIQIGKKFYCGGKEDDDKGGVKGDLLYKNDLTQNIAFIEIKTPEKDILGSKYRGEDGKANVIYSMSGELTGGVNQVLNQKKVYIETFGDQSGKFSHNAKCILIIGKIEKLKSEDEKKSFELYRSSTANVEVVTYDELFGRIEFLVNLLK